VAHKDRVNVSALVFDRILFDPHMGRYTLRLTSVEKDNRQSLHIPMQGGPEEMMVIPLLLVDPLLRHLFKTLRIKVESITLENTQDSWKGRVVLRWGWWKKTLAIRPLDAIRFSVEFHKPILVPSDMVRPVMVEKDRETKKEAYRALFMPRKARPGDIPYEEIM